ncbi:hypothetical protein BH10BAC3_BH10BAC3_12550 [soil metagenome]
MKVGTSTIWLNWNTYEYNRHKYQSHYCLKKNEEADLEETKDDEE